ncbi:hypothetical protein PAPYR_13011 [Paratrimastix pyriformis]|uniref:Uncharacterized protein n=1 Tax=Paratrimastix pyriformis TaxID=342808 RepID=A0ABQ8U0Z9_9EUKA|nr:hypothetical protein PAPYR_13011 [Paratrimastix pyriformis]
MQQMQHNRDLLMRKERSSTLRSSPQAHRAAISPTFRLPLYPLSRALHPPTTPHLQARILATASTRHLPLCSCSPPLASRGASLSPSLWAGAKPVPSRSKTLGAEGASANEMEMLKTKIRSGCARSSTATGPQAALASAAAPDAEKKPAKKVRFHQELQVRSTGVRAVGLAFFVCVSDLSPCNEHSGAEEVGVVPEPHEDSGAEVEYDDDAEHTEKASVSAARRPRPSGTLLPGDAPGLLAGVRDPVKQLSDSMCDSKVWSTELDGALFDAPLTILPRCPLFRDDAHHARPLGHQHSPPRPPRPCPPSTAALGLGQHAPSSPPSEGAPAAQPLPTMQPLPTVRPSPSRPRSSREEAVPRGTSSHLTHLVQDGASEACAVLVCHNPDTHCLAATPQLLSGTCRAGHQRSMRPGAGHPLEPRRFVPEGFQAESERYSNNPASAWTHAHGLFSRHAAIQCLALSPVNRQPQDRQKMLRRDDDGRKT